MLMNKFLAGAYNGFGSLLERQQKLFKVSTWD